MSGYRDPPGMSLSYVGVSGPPRDVPALCQGTGMSPGCPCPLSGHRAVPGGSPVPSPCPRALTPVATPAVLRQPPGAVACPCPRLPPRCPSRERGRARWATSREKISREKQNKKTPGMAGSVSPDTSRPLPCATAVPPRPPGVPAQLRSCPSAASPQRHQCPNPGLSRRQSAPVSPDLPCQPRCVTKCHPRPPNPPCQPRPAPSHRDPKSIPLLPTKSIPPVPPNPSHPYPKFTSPVPPKSIPPLPTKSIPPVPQNPSHPCPKSFLPAPKSIPPVPPNPSPPPSPSRCHPGPVSPLCPAFPGHSRHRDRLAAPTPNPIPNPTPALIPPPIPNPIPDNPVPPSCASPAPSLCVPSVPCVPVSLRHLPVLSRAPPHPAGNVARGNVARGNVACGNVACRNVACGNVARRHGPGAVARAPSPAVGLGHSREFLGLSLPGAAPVGDPGGDAPVAVLTAPPRTWHLAPGCPHTWHLAVPALGTRGTPRSPPRALGLATAPHGHRWSRLGHPRPLGAVLALGTAWHCPPC
ncbi:uncharacterized protein [Agelaius tricolor]